MCVCPVQDGGQAMGRGREGGRERGAGGRGEREQRRSWSRAGGVAGVLLHWVGAAPPLSEVAGGSSYMQMKVIGPNP